MANKQAGIVLGLGAIVGGLVLLLWPRKKAAAPPPPPGLANLYGQVTDSVTHQPIAGVRVEMIAAVTRQRYTDATGNYIVPDIEPGVFDIKFTMEDYETLTLSGVNILEGNNELNTQLVPVVFEVGPFAYSGEFFELRPLTELDPDAGTLSVYAVFRCMITNPGTVSRTRNIGLYYSVFSVRFGNWSTPILVNDPQVHLSIPMPFDLTLAPGETYQFIFDPRLYPIDIARYIWTDLLSVSHMTYGGVPMPQTVYLKDDAGGESARLMAF